MQYPQVAKLPTVQAEALGRALKLLSASGVQFAVVEPDGTKHGTLDVAPPKSTSRRAGRFPRGTMLAHYLPFVQDVQPGQMVLIPYGSFDADDDSKSALRASLASWCSAKWGNKTYITHNNAQGIELLRVE